VAPSSSEPRTMFHIIQLVEEYQKKRSPSSTPMWKAMAL
jgi:hypothetical protein